MNTTALLNVPELVAEAKQSTDQARNLLLGTFQHVPDDKLTWSPSPAARSAIQIVAHCGMANQAFATVLRGEDLPIVSAEEAAQKIREAGRDLTDRDTAVRLVDSSTEAVLQALDNVTPEMLETSPTSPFGPFPFLFWMKLPGVHMSGHACQIDYLQTIWATWRTTSKVPTANVKPCIVRLS